MAIIKCKMCGGDIALNEEKTFGTCEYCGSTMTLPRVSDDQRAARFNRGNFFRRKGDFDKALEVYESIVMEDDADAEAHWCCALCRFGIEYVEDPNTLEYLPTCHRASFDSFLEDVDYLAALEHSSGVTKRQYQKDAAKIAEVQRGILATSRNEEPFDVFLCYKETDDDTNQRTSDSQDAEEMYRLLTQEGYRVFFSRITMKDKGGTQYEPYIFAALNSAKVMVVVGSKPEYFNAVWVKNEWSRFLGMMRKDRSKLLLLCYKNMDPNRDLPSQLSGIQSYDMGAFGSMQYMIRMINKTLRKDEPASASQPAPQQVIIREAGGPNTANLLRRGNMFLEEKNWTSAAEYFNKVLDAEAENSSAYLGMAMINVKASNLAAFVKNWSNRYSNERPQPLAAREPDVARIEAAAARLAVPGYLPAQMIRERMDYSLSYLSRVESARKNREKTLSDLASDREFSRAKQYGDPALNTALRDAEKQIEQACSARIKAAEKDAEAAKAEVCRRYPAHLAEQEAVLAAENRNALARRESDYRAACELQAAADTAAAYAQAAARFESAGLRGYRDSNQRLSACLGEKKRLETAEAKARRARQTRSTRIGCLVFLFVVLVIIAAIVAVVILVPKAKYNAAEALQAEGKFDEAQAAFKALGNYKDSADRASGMVYLKAEALLAAGDYDGAAKIYKSLHESEKVDAVNYARGEALLAAKEFDEAEEVFRNLGDYSDSADRVNGCIYAKADALFAERKYDEGIPIFLSLGDYSDSADRVGAYYYEKAEAYLEEGNPVYAAFTFGCADPSYRDARERSFALWDEFAQRDTIAAGGSFSAGLREDGTVVVASSPSDSYSKAEEWTDIIALTGGVYQLVGLHSDGTVVAVGRNEENDITNAVAIAAPEYCTLCLKADGRVDGFGSSWYGEGSVEDWTNIVALSCSDSHTVGLKADGTVIATGTNSYGQCSVEEWKDIVAVAAGGARTVGLYADGTVIAIGKNDEGQCEVDGWSDIVSVALSSSLTVGVKADGTIVTAGKAYDGADFSDWTDIVAVAAGDRHFIGLKSDGTVVSTGADISNCCQVDGWAGIKLPD